MTTPPSKTTEHAPTAARSWHSERDADGIVWLTLDCAESSTNTLGRAVLEELDQELDRLAANLPRGIVIKSAKPAGFIAGADIKEFTTLQSAASIRAQVERGQRVFAKLEALPCPSVAMIHGFALGGGLELALACSHRVALRDDRLALSLPEVQLGIHPGFGGTVRAVRRIGAALALDMMLTGRTIRASRVLQMNLVDALCDDPAALEKAARDAIFGRLRARRAGFVARALSAAPLRPLLRRQIQAKLRRKAKPEHYPAPYAILDLWAQRGAHGDHAYRAEADSIVALAQTDTTRNLVRIFLLQDALKGKLSREVRAPERVHVIGAGVMGGDIAAYCAQRGCTVTLQDQSAAALEAAMTRADTLFAKRGAEAAAAARARLQLDAAGEGLATADIVIEAIVEDLAIKRRLFADVETRVRHEAVLATNTSSIPLEEIASVLHRPERLVGLHFFNPVAAMPLVEIVRSRHTATEALEIAAALTRRLDKLPLPCRSAPGFLVNRVLVPYLNEALYAAADGIPLELIDRTAKDFGMPMGPVELSDMVGLDVCLHVGEIIGKALGRRGPDPAPIRERIAAGHLGRKSGQGFYRWQDGRVVRESHSSDRRSARHGDNAVPAELLADLEDRLLLSLVNECVACLRSGIVEDVGTLDAGVIFGTGFAPFRGGPLAYAATRGIDRCVSRLEELANRYGERFRPDPGWQSLAAQLSAAAATTSVR